MRKLFKKIIAALLVTVLLCPSSMSVHAAVSLGQTEDSCAAAAPKIQDVNNAALKFPFELPWLKIGKVSAPKVKRDENNAARITISWNTAKNAEWYTVEYSRKRFGGFRTINTKNFIKTNTVWTVPEKGQTYYIRVAAWKWDGSKTVKKVSRAVQYKCVPRKLNLRKQRIGDMWRIQWAKEGIGIKEKVDGLEIQRKSGRSYLKYAETTKRTHHKYDVHISNAKGRTFRVATYFQLGKKRVYGKWSVISFPK